MAKFALIENGSVSNVVMANAGRNSPPGQMWVQIDTISPEPGIGWDALETSGSWTFTPPPTTPPTLAQQAAAALGAGLTITSTGTPAINGTYAIADGVAFGRNDIGTEAQFISTFQEFTNGTQTLEWPLIDGKTFVTFPSTATFMNFAKAAAQYYAAVKAVAALGAGTLPSASVTIP